MTSGNFNKFVVFFENIALVIIDMCSNNNFISWMKNYVHNGNAKISKWFKFNLMFVEKQMMKK